MARLPSDSLCKLRVVLNFRFPFHLWRAWTIDCYCRIHSKGLFSIKLSIESGKKTEVAYSRNTIKVKYRNCHSVGKGSNIYQCHSLERRKKTSYPLEVKCHTQL